MKKEINKKGMSEIISWVMLVGLGIALAALVTNWAINNVRQIDPSKNADMDLYCQDISISINKQTCSISNTGLFGIDKIKVQTRINTREIAFSARLQPGNQEDLTLYGEDCQEVLGYIPVRKTDEGRDIVCSTKKITI